MAQAKTKRKAGPRAGGARRKRGNSLPESIAGGAAAGTAVVAVKKILDLYGKKKNPYSREEREAMTEGVAETIRAMGFDAMAREFVKEPAQRKRIISFIYKQILQKKLLPKSQAQQFKKLGWSIGSLGKNPASAGAAAKGFEDFHGRSATEVLTMQESALKGGSYFALGDEPELWLAPVKGAEPDTWPRPSIVFEKKDGVKLVADRAGRQLYFTGNTAIAKADLKKLGGDTGKRFVPLGTAHAVSYTTDKHFDGYQTKTYAHEFGEETGEKPIVIYDQDFKALLLVGGAYSIAEKDLSLNASPGIVN